jgi:O-acetyl-ADP-ribose deacetylase (regulator of RNase III)
VLTYVRTSLFDSPAQTLVNTVNLVGVMGKGVALEFKSRYPDMFKAYRSLCDQHALEIGKLHLWRATDHWILNFPTKTTWKKPSKLDYIEAGLDVFLSSYRGMGISSISFPPLGCGNGNLDWNDVRPVMERYLSKLEIPVYVHDRQVTKGFIPEHIEVPIDRIPVSFVDFLQDIREQVIGHRGKFLTLKSRSLVEATWHADNGITISRANRASIIRPELIEWAWVALQSGILSADQFPGEDSRKAKSYLFPILANLPYVRVTEISKPEWSSGTPAHGLYIKRTDRKAEVTSVAVPTATDDQFCLSL